MGHSNPLSHFFYQSLSHALSLPLVNIVHGIFTVYRNHVASEITHGEIIKSGIEIGIGCGLEDPKSQLGLILFNKPNNCTLIIGGHGVSTGNFYLL